MTQQLHNLVFLSLLPSGLISDVFSAVSGVSEEHEWAALLLESVWRSFGPKRFYKWESVKTASPPQGRGVCQSHALFDDSRWKITH